MRSLRNPLLLLGVPCAALICAGSASAVVIDVLGPAGSTVYPSDEIALTVLLDTEGVSIEGYQFHVAYDPAVLSFLSASPTPPPQFYAYGVNPEGPGAIIVDGTRFFGDSVVNQTVMSLVFHVMDAPSSTVTNVAPYLSAYDGIWLPGGYEPTPIPADSLGPGVTLHVVPEPATGMLLGLGLVGFLHRAGGRRST